ncbi:P2012 hydrolase, partial [Polypterus senegalus]
MSRCYGSISPSRLSCPYRKAKRVPVTPFTILLRSHGKGMLAKLGERRPGSSARHPRLNNIISPYAEAIVNFRIHNAQTTDEVLQIVSDTIADDRVKVEVISAGEPLPISSYNATSFGYQIIKKTAQEIFPQVVVAPGVCVGSSDSKHFVEVCDEILRFVPTWFKIEDLSR